MIDDDAIRFLFDLVATPSASGHERAAAEVFVRHAAALGFDAHIDDAGNAVAQRGDPDAPPIALLGHIDTVPGHIPVRVEGRTLHGRGSVDAKGPLAALLLGAARAELPESARIVVIGAVGEETPRSPGARFVRDRLCPVACIIGEPSGWDAVTLAYKGRLIVRAEVAQPCAHSAGPHGSALDAILDWAQRERTLGAAQHGAGAFDRVQVTARDASAASDGLTDRAALTLALRLPPGAAPQEIEGAIRARAPKGVRLSFEGHERAAVSARTDAVVRALSGAIAPEGGRPRHLRKTGTSDMNVVAPVWNCPICAYGPGDSSLDHTPDERLDLDEFLRSLRILTRAVETLATEAAATPSRPAPLPSPCV